MPAIPDLPIYDLAAPFPAVDIHWRIGQKTKDGKKAMVLAYIDARDVMGRLDAVCGPANWQCEYSHVSPITVCRIGIRINGEWVWKSNGAGTSDIEAEKGAMSDAFKRAAVLWGIGQYLYDVESPWVTLTDDTKWAKIAPHEYARLHKLVGGSTASQLKKQDAPMDDNAWKEFLAELYQTTSLVQVVALYRDREQTWPGSWLEQAKEACAERRVELAKLDVEHDKETGEIIENAERNLYKAASEGK